MTATTISEIRRHESWTETLTQFENYIRHISRGLVEFQTRDVYEQYELGVEVSEREAHLIHQSVADYLREAFLKNVKYDRHISQSCVGAGHFQISRSCLRYLALKEILEATKLPRSTLSARFHLTPYATRYMFEHIKEVEQQGILQPDLLTLLQWDTQSESLGKVASIWTVLEPNNVHTPTGWPFVGMTTLHVLVALGSKSALDTNLRGNSVDVAKKDSDENTALHLAIREHQQDIALTLLEETQWKDLNVSDNDGRTPLSLAAEAGQESVAELLLGTDTVDVEAKDAYGWTSLSWAARNGHGGVVKLLLGTGKVDIDGKDEDGRTPLSMAAQTGHEGVVKLLQAHLYHLKGLQQ
ncbi:ankyrin [Polyplosphaeria fusca]|uniref:Ankyrin n=1 Tax=Polyplosphaeria fusca TaxID=682080 RepID=A0A9P4QYK1_9PLEO|nr:ankyrin [Polyplosphaeria fusca]